MHPPRFSSRWIAATAATAAVVITLVGLPFGIASATESTGEVKTWSSCSPAYDNGYSQRACMTVTAYRNSSGSWRVTGIRVTHQRGYGTQEWIEVQARRTNPWEVRNFRSPTVPYPYQRTFTYDVPIDPNDTYWSNFTGDVIGRGVSYCACWYTTHNYTGWASADLN